MSTLPIFYDAERLGVYVRVNCVLPVTEQGQDMYRTLQR